jgi:hypothetical protein
MKRVKETTQLFFIVPALLLVFTRCTVTPDKVAGTGSQAGNGMVVATVSNPDGSPAENVQVYIRDKGYLKDTAAIGTQKIPDAVTDSKGRFEIDSVDPGTYFIELYDGISCALLIECVKESATVIDSGITDLGAISLQPVAAFSGIVERENIPDSVAVYIQLYGLEHARKVDVSGEFSFDYVPPGMLTLRIFSGDSSLGIVDSESIKVDPAETVDAGIFRLPFEYWRDTVIVRGILDSNGQTDISVDFVTTKKNGRIDVLNLTKMGIWWLPAEIRDLRITHFYLGFNFIEYLPFEIGEIPSLEYLDLMRNRIRMLPPTFSTLKKLKHLNVSENDLRGIQSEIGKLTSLEYLSARSNVLDRITGSIGNLVKLRFLDLSDNRLDSLPSEITNLTEFDFLSVNYNKLLSVPPDIEEWLNTHSTDKDWKETQGITGNGKKKGEPLIVPFLGGKKPSSL